MYITIEYRDVQVDYTAEPNIKCKLKLFIVAIPKCLYRVAHIL